MASQRTNETDLKQQLELLRSEKRTLTKELADLQAKLTQLEADKTNFNNSQDLWKREKHALVKKIELLEGEKRRTDAAIRETALQREAIEKSLNAMASFYELK